MHVTQDHSGIVHHARTATPVALNIGEGLIRRRMKRVTPGNFELPLFMEL